MSFIRSFLGKKPFLVFILNIFILVEALTYEVLLHLWEQMEVGQCKSGLWWMW